eukprot:293384_1
MSFEESKQQDGVRVNHYEVAIESVKSIEAILVKLGANPHGKASDKLKDVCAIFRKKYKFTFPQTLRNEIRSIFQYGNRIRHDPNCKKIEDCFDFASKMCSINFGFRLIFDAIAKGDASFEFALNKNYNYHQTNIYETDPNLERYVAHQMNENRKITRTVATFNIEGNVKEEEIIEIAVTNRIGVAAPY